MKTITENPEEFFETGGWSFLDPDSDNEKEEVDDEEEDEDEAYEVIIVYIFPYFFYLYKKRISLINCHKNFPAN